MDKCRENGSIYRKMILRTALSMFILVIGLDVILLALIALCMKLGIISSGGSVSVAALFIIGTICLICASIGSYNAMWNYFKPMQSIADAANRISAGDYNVKVTLSNRRKNVIGRGEYLKKVVESFNKMAEELSSVEMMRSDFIANVSHEFKTPLTTLSGYLTLLQDSDISDEERDEYIRKAFFSIGKLNDLTENILRLSKLENKAILDPPVTYRLDEQLREAVLMLEPKWSEKGIVFDIRMSEMSYTGQRSLLFQVWTNLIGNAIKFSEDGSTVGIGMEKTPHHIKVYISDNGTGMTQEQQAHIFDKFYQADTSRQEQGNGLGLALCREIVDKCGGRIYVNSEPGKGSVFVVTLRINEDRVQY